MYKSNSKRDQTIVQCNVVKQTYNYLQIQNLDSKSDFQTLSFKCVSPACIFDDQQVMHCKDISTVS